MQNPNSAYSLVGDTDPLDPVLDSSAADAAWAAGHSGDHVADDQFGDTDPFDSVQLATVAEFARVAGSAGHPWNFIHFADSVIGDTDPEHSVLDPADTESACDTRGATVSVGLGGVKGCELEFAVI